MPAMELLMLGGGLFVPLLWALWVWRSRARWRARLERESCRLCGTPFSEAIYELLGTPTEADRARLDAFQRRYLRCRVLCRECEAINLVADNGTPMAAYPAEALVG